MQTPTFPRVNVTDADPEAVSFVQTLLRQAAAEEDHVRTQQRGLARAMVALGKPIYRSGPAKPKKPTKHVRHMARMAERSAA